MYRILLVEDEPIERKGIRLMLESNCTNIDQICEASNGFQAIEICKEFKPHIVLVDMHMPGLNGLETIKALQEIDPMTHYIILTSHGRFEYAQQAISLGVQDYLLKPARIACLKEAMEKIFNKLEHSMQEKNQQAVLFERINDLRPIWERDCIRSLVSGQEPSGACGFHLLDFEVMGGFCFIILLPEASESFIQIVRHNLQAINIECIGENIEGELVFFALLRQQGVTVEAQSLIGYLLASMGGDIHLDNVRIGVSPLCKESSELKYAYAQARLSLGSAKRGGEAYSRKSGFDARGESIDAQQIVLTLQRAMATKDMFLQRVAAVAEQLAGEHETMNEVLAQFSQWLQRKGYIAEETGYRELSITRLDKNDKSRIFQNVLLELVQRYWKQDDRFSDTLAGRVLEYIDTNYMKQVTLDVLAEQFHVTPYYLSRLIKAKFGRSFPDVLAERRIRQAKYLLKKGDSIKSVTYTVGFSSQNYFGKTFKKNTGMTPGDYQERYLENE